VVAGPRPARGGEPLVDADSRLARAAEAFVHDIERQEPDSGGSPAAVSVEGGEPAQTHERGERSPAPRPPGRVHSLGVANSPPILTALEWETTVHSESARLARYHRPLAIVVVCLDWQEHDGSGQSTEDALRLLRPVGRTLRRQARASDRVARLGRDSFAIMLMETADLGAAVYAARVRDACRPWLAAAPVDVDLRLGWAVAAAGAMIETAVLAAIAGTRRDSAASVWNVAPTPARPRLR
jgi:hypothetical protein